MPFRFRTSVKLLPGTRLNISKRGLSTSSRIGPVTLNSRGTGSVRVMRGVSYQFGTRRRAGAPRQVQQQVVVDPLVDFLLALLGGWLGLHRFYRRQVLLGVVYLLTVGLFGIGWLVDAIIAGVRLRAR